MFASVSGILLGMLMGVRHALEPDHLSAVTTMMAETRDARRSAVLGAVWGLGHTISLIIVGTALLLSGTMLSERMAASFEFFVALMLIVLGIRALVLASREGAIGGDHLHAHDGHAHVHRGPAAHVHVGGHVLALRPLLVGLVHGAAGSGALTALVFAELPTFHTRVFYIVLFGFGSVVGMGVASGIAGASFHRFATTPSRRRWLAVASGVLSISVGVVWAVPAVSLL